MFTIVLSPKAKRDLENLDKPAKEKVSGALSRLGESPFLGKKLAGKYKYHYSARAWPYRTTYRIFPEDRLLIVVRIGHRRDVYR